MQHRSCYRISTNNGIDSKIGRIGVDYTIKSLCLCHAMTLRLTAYYKEEGKKDMANSIC